MDVRPVGLLEGLGLELRESLSGLLPRQGDPESILHDSSDDIVTLNLRKIIG